MNKTHYILGFFVVLSFFISYYINKENELLKAKLDAANIKLKLQNQKIQELSVEIKPAEIKETKRIKKIFVKDNTCESELKAYKELFNEAN